MNNPFAPKPTCYESDRVVQRLDLLVSVDNEFDLTTDRIYVAQGIVYGDIAVVNDTGELVVYSTEYFRFYEGEKIR